MFQKSSLTRVSGALVFFIILTLLTWAAVAALALLRSEEPEIDALTTIVGPLVAVLLIGWLPARIGLSSSHGNLKSKLGDPLPAFKMTTGGWLGRGLGVGVLGAGVWQGIQGFISDDTLLLGVAAGASLFGLLSAIGGHVAVARCRRLQSRPWRILTRIQHLRALGEPDVLVRWSRQVQWAAKESLPRDVGELLIERSRRILAALGDRTVEKWKEQVASGDLARARETLTRWESAAHAEPELFGPLGLSVECIAGLQRELEEAVGSREAERERTLLTELDGAEAALAAHDPAKALQIAAQVRSQLAAQPVPAGSTLPGRVESVETRAGQMALADKEAAERQRAEEEIATQLASAREAATNARAHLDRGDAESAAGWLEHAEAALEGIPSPARDELAQECAAIRSALSQMWSAAQAAQAAAAQRAEQEQSAQLREAIGHARAHLQRGSVADAAGWLEHTEGLFAALAPAARDSLAGEMADLRQALGVQPQVADSDAQAAVARVEEAIGYAQGHLSLGDATSACGWLDCAADELQGVSASQRDALMRRIDELRASVRGVTA